MNTVAVINRPAIGKKQKAIYTASDIDAALERKKTRVIRYAYSPVISGNYSKAECVEFQRTHGGRAPVWKPGDAKITWRIVVEYTKANKGDKAWKWFSGTGNDYNEYPGGEFMNYVNKLPQKNIILSDGVCIKGDTQSADDIGTFDAFKEACDDILNESDGTGNTEEGLDDEADSFDGCARRVLEETGIDEVSAHVWLTNLVKENLRLKEENGIMRSRLRRISYDISKSFAILDNVDNL